MFPWSPEFRWDVGHVVFFAAFYGVLTTIVLTLLTSARRAQRSLQGGLAAPLAWRASFEELPPAARACRHQLTGNAPQRVCANGFDCRSCATHPTLAASRSHTDSDQDSARCFGLNLPLDRLYHRGHTWLRLESDGTATAGLDDLARRLVGRVETVELPKPGTRLAVGGTAARLHTHGSDVRILAPIEGTVVASHGSDAAFTLRIQPDGVLDVRHLLGGQEVRAWMLRELERLQGTLGAFGAGATLADGGELVADVGAALPPRAFDALLGEIFLSS